jgi:hypothetical protein
VARISSLILRGEELTATPSLNSNVNRRSLMSRTTKKKTRSKKRFISYVEYYKMQQLEINMLMNELVLAMIKQGNRKSKIKTLVRKPYGKA